MKYNYLTIADVPMKSNLKVEEAGSKTGVFVWQFYI